MSEHEAASTVEALQQLIDEATDDDHVAMIQWQRNGFRVLIGRNDLYPRGPLVCWRRPDNGEVVTCHYLQVSSVLHRVPRTDLQTG